MGKISEKITSLIMGAMKEKNPIKTNTYRAIKKAFIDYKVSDEGIATCSIDQDTKERIIPDDVEINIIKKMAKMRRDSIDVYCKNGREDLVKSEQEELGYLNEFLPKEATDDEILSVINEWKKSNGTYDKSKISILVREVKTKYPTADGKKVFTIVQSNIG